MPSFRKLPRLGVVDRTILLREVKESRGENLKIKRRSPSVSMREGLRRFGVILEVLDSGTVGASFRVLDADASDVGTGVDCVGDRG